MLKLIKEAQMTDKLDDEALSHVSHIKKVLGVALDESLVASAKSMKKVVESDDFALKTDQMIDQIVNYLAPQEGMDGRYLDAKKFKKLAGIFRIELEDHYDEVYSPSEWNQMTAAAFQAYSQKGPSRNPAEQENEEDTATINAGRDRLAREDKFRQERNQRRQTADDLWATRYIKKPVDRAAAMDYENEEDDHPAFGKRDWDAESETKPHDSYLRYRANGGNLSREQRAFDRDQRNPWDREEDEEVGIDGEIVNQLKDILAKGEHLKSGILGCIGNIVNIEDSGATTIRINRPGMGKHGVFNINRVPGGVRLIKRGDTYVVVNAGSEENEESGWPSDEAPEDDSNQYRQRDDAMSNDPELEDELNKPWPEENEERGERRDPIAAGPHSTGSRPGDVYNDDEQRARYKQAMAAVDHLYGRPQQKSPMREEENQEDSMTQEQQGWYDAQKGGTPKFPHDSEYMTGWERSTAMHGKKETENEETSGSMLKSLLAKRSEVSKKASEVSKKYETEGAKAFHEIRMKHEKSPYCPNKQGEEHTAWTKGWQKAAMQHYNPEPEADVKKPAKKKPAKKK